MPADPREFLIVKNLQAALQAIDVAAGYHFTVPALAVKLDPNHDVEALIAPDGPRPFLILEPKEERWEYDAAQQLRLTMPVTIHWISESTPTDPDSRLSTYLRGCADVEAAIALDVGRGGLAVDTRIVKRTFDTAVEGAQVWAMVDTEIAVYRTYGQPNG